MDINSSLRAFQPRYQKVKRWLEDQLRRSAWEVGEKIPGEAVLARNLDVSAITVRQALNALAEEGFLRREKGRGTFVAKTWTDGAPVGRGQSDLIEGADVFKGKAFGILLPEGVEISRRKRRIIEALEQGISNDGGRTVIVQCPLGSGVALRKKVSQLDGFRAFIFFEHEILRFGAKVLPDILKLKVPVVACDYLGSLCISRVVEDHGWGMRLAVEHLASLGHRRILLAEMRQKDAANWIAVRSRAFLEACRDCGLVAGSEDIVMADGEDAGPLGSMDIGRKIAAQVFESRMSYTAIIGINDHVALGVLDEVGKRSAPVAVVGFDNILESGVANLTTLATPTAGMGAAIIDLLRGLDGRTGLVRDDMYHQIVLRPLLICRESSRAGAGLL
jgi:DNA-binding LacI/PurR family transcriptional regulator/DNA-binding transcriptional regulator YhcF (GntR family)